MFKDGVEFMTASVMTYIGVFLGIMHWAFGFLTELYGIDIAFAMVPFLQVLCVVFLLFTKNKESNI